MTNHVYQQFAGFVYTGMRKYHLSKEASLDAYTDAIVGLCRRVEQADFQMDGNLSGYVYRSFCNRCVDRIRKNTSSQIDSLPLMPELPDMAKNILGQLLNQESFERISRIMDELGERCKNILMDAEYWGYSVQEMVKKFGFKDANGLSSQKYRCMTKLRKLISVRMKGEAEP